MNPDDYYPAEMTDEQRQALELERLADAARCAGCDCSCMEVMDRVRAEE